LKKKSTIISYLSQFISLILKLEARKRGNTKEKGGGRYEASTLRDFRLSP
jgi:hypothetical protein